MIATEKRPVLQTQNIARRLRKTVQPGKGDGMFLTILQQHKVNENIRAIL